MKATCVPSGADTYIADPARSFKQYFAYGEFKALLATIAPHHSEIFAVAGDVGVINVIQDGRGAPPSSGKRASVPRCNQVARKRRFRMTAISPLSAMPSTSASRSRGVA